MAKQTRSMPSAVAAASKGGGPGAVRANEFGFGGDGAPPSSGFFVRRKDFAFCSAESDRHVAPVFDWRERRSETGATPACGGSRGGKYPG